jgi:hypothetical protein
MLFCNANILDKNNPLSFEHWTKSKIITVRDIWNIEQNKWKSGELIYNKLNKKTNWMVEFVRIKKAIPEKWKNCLNNINDRNLTVTSHIQNKQKVIITHNIIEVNNRIIDPNKFRTKDIYCHCLYPIKKPTCIDTWETLLLQEIAWDEICQIFNNSIQRNKQKDYHWKVVHRAIYSESRLSRMGKSNGICKLCNNLEENTCHLLYYCEKINPVWAVIEERVNNIINTEVNIDISTVILGMSARELGISQYIVNLFIYEAKWQIWKNRNAVKYGKEACITVDKLCANIRNGCKTVVKLFQGSNGRKKLKLKLEPFFSKMFTIDSE